MMLNAHDSERFKLQEHESAWNVLTEEYYGHNIPKGAIVITSREIPEKWNLRECQLVVVIVEGEGDRGPTGAPFIRTMEMDDDGDILLEPNGFDPKFPVRFIGFVTEVIERR